MSVDERKLDGNAIGGLLREIFTMEMTAAETTCAGCGAVNAVGRNLAVVVNQAVKENKFAGGGQQAASAE